MCRPDSSASATLASLLIETLEKYSESRLSYLFVHLHLLSSHCFSSLTLPTSAFPSVHIVGSLTSKLPSIISVCCHVQPADRFTCKKSVEHPSTEHSSSPGKTGQWGSSGRKMHLLSNFAKCQHGMTMWRFNRHISPPVLPKPLLDLNQPVQSGWRSSREGAMSQVVWTQACLPHWARNAVGQDC